LLVVVAVLSATALAAFGLMSEDRGQVRADDTRARLAILRRAVVGLDAPAYGGEARLSGFVVDNGRLPDDLQELLAAPASVALFRAALPDIDKEESLDADCFRDSASLPESGSLPGNDKELALFLLPKGHRGNYLGGAAQNGVFRDGWGNARPESTGDSEPDRNFGWEFDLPANASSPLVIRSRGADNKVGGVLPEEADIPMTIRPEDWQVDLDGWRVLLRNARKPAEDGSASGGKDNDAEGDDTEGGGGAGGNEDAEGSEGSGEGTGGENDGALGIGEFGASGSTTFGDLRAVLLVFENTASGGRWRWLRSARTTCAGKKSLEAGESCVLLFSSTATCGKGGSGDRATIPARAPIGRHLLVLTLSDPDDDDKDSLPELGMRRVTPVDFHPGTLQPVITWEFR
jgi:hypothetical protein